MFTGRSCNPKSVPVFDVDRYVKLHGAAVAHHRMVYQINFRDFNSTGTNLLKSALKTFIIRMSGCRDQKHLQPRLLDKWDVKCGVCDASLCTNKRCRWLLHSFHESSLLCATTMYILYTAPKSLEISTYRFCVCARCKELATNGTLDWKSVSRLATTTVRNAVTGLLLVMHRRRELRLPKELVAKIGQFLAVEERSLYSE